MTSEEYEKAFGEKARALHIHWTNQLLGPTLRLLYEAAPQHTKDQLVALTKLDVAQRAEKLDGSSAGRAAPRGQVGGSSPPRLEVQASSPPRRKKKSPQ